MDQFLVKLNAPGAPMLQLQRAPLFLRFTRTAAGEWDALDQLTDKARPGEELIVGLRVATGSMHLKCGRRSKIHSGFYRTAEYNVYDQQPSQELLRSSDRWETWCYGRLEAPDDVDTELEE